MIALLLALACKGSIILDDSAEPSDTVDSTPEPPNEAAVELTYSDGEHYGDPLFYDGTLLLPMRVQDLIVAIDPASPADYRFDLYNLGSVAVPLTISPRVREIPGVGLWLSGDPLTDEAAHIVDPATLQVLREIPNGGEDAAMHSGGLVTAYPGIWQTAERANEPGRLEGINADDSLTTLDPALCGEVGRHCGEAMITMGGALWWTDYQGGLYTSGSAYHLEDGVLVAGAPAVVEGEPARHNRTRLADLGDGWLWVGGVVDCGAALHVQSGAQVSYPAADGCGFSAVSGQSYHGSAVRVVSLDLALGGGGYGALRVEWLDGVHAGAVEVLTLPFPDESYSCWPIVAIGPEGRIAVTCDGTRGLFLGRITG